MKISALRALKKCVMGKHLRKMTLLIYDMHCQLLPRIAGLEPFRFIRNPNYCQSRANRLASFWRYPHPDSRYNAEDACAGHRPTGRKPVSEVDSSIVAARPFWSDQW